MTHKVVCIPVPLTFGVIVSIFSLPVPPFIPSGYLPRVVLPVKSPGFISISLISSTVYTFSKRLQQLGYLSSLVPLFVLYFVDLRVCDMMI